MRCRAAGSTLGPLLKEAQTHPAQIELLQPGPTGKKGHGTQGKQAQRLLHWQRPRGARRHPPLHLQEQSLALEGRSGDQWAHPFGSLWSKILAHQPHTPSRARHPSKPDSDCLVVTDTFDS